MNYENISEMVEKAVAEIMPDIEDMVFTAIIDVLSKYEENVHIASTKSKIQEDTGK